MLFSQAVTFPWTPYFHDAYGPAASDVTVTPVVRQKQASIGRLVQLEQASTSRS
jgi:hypothetical protein